MFPHATGARKSRKGNSQPIPVNAGDLLKEAKVQSMLTWGAFIDVGNGYQGLLHVDEMVTPEGATASSAFDILKEGQVLEVSLAAALLLLLCLLFALSPSYSAWLFLKQGTVT